MNSNVAIIEGYNGDLMRTHNNRWCGLKNAGTRTKGEVMQSSNQILKEINDYHENFSLENQHNGKYFLFLAFARLKE